MDPPETIEHAIWTLSHLQAQGWTLDKIEFKIEHRRQGNHGPKMPARARLVIELEPFL